MAGTTGMARPRNLAPGGVASAAAPVAPGKHATPVSANREMAEQTMGRMVHPSMGATTRHDHSFSHGTVFFAGAEKRG